MVRRFQVSTSFLFSTVVLAYAFYTVHLLTIARLCLPFADDSVQFRMSAPAAEMPNLFDDLEIHAALCRVYAGDSSGKYNPFPSIILFYSPCQSVQL